ncbi:MAG: SCO family protein [Planctomycetota bacterium]
MKLHQLLTLALLPLFACAGAASDEVAPCCADEPAPAGMATADLPGTSLYLLDGDWTDQTGHARTLSSFHGEIVVAAMVFTHCQYACPMMLQDLKDIESKIPESDLPKVRWLLLSMDSERDQPEVLADYAKRNHLDTERWTLLHGEDYPVRGIAAALGINYVKDVNGNFSHSNKITVLKADGSIAYQLEGLNAANEPCVEAIMNEIAKD